ncbi:Sulfotransferase [Fasciola hepatica]|uniref:Sulfotransferase n=1 Tax=Fasciola hepatica TaxID=6192 RepID=A0A2H1CLQ5_FASHE|nr:Sulfotransferase [Fasciola hepatica]
MSKADNSPILVIGAGLGRTGTKSLKDALELLYQRPCYHMFEVEENHLDHLKLWSKLFDLLGENPDAELPQDVIKRLFDGYFATTDFPACSIYRQIMRLYPEAKVVLTVRDPYKWIQSVRETIRPKWSLFGRYRWDRVTEKLLSMEGVAEVTDRAMKHCLGQNIDLNDDDQMVKGFNRWIDEVRRMVPAEKLLVFEVKHGWEPLCRFLNKPIPDAPFPRSNDRAELKARIADLYKQALFKLSPGLVVLVMAMMLGIYWSTAT